MERICNEREIDYEALPFKCLQRCTLMPLRVGWAHPRRYSTCANTKLYISLHPPPLQVTTLWSVATLSLMSGSHRLAPVPCPGRPRGVHTFIMRGAHGCACKAHDARRRPHVETLAEGLT